MCFGNKSVYVYIFLLIFSITSISDSFATLPTGPIEITVENVTINTPKESSSEESESENKVLGEVIAQGLTIIGATATATVGAIFAYITRRQVPTTLEQEKLFNDIMKEAYYESYLPIWRKIWEIIDSQDNEDNQQKFIDYLWKHYFGKRQIPTLIGLEQIKNPSNLPDTPPPAKKPEDARDAFVSYAILKVKRFHLNSISKNENLMKEKLTYLFNEADVKYYSYITESLPNFVERAVLATDNPSKYKTIETVGNWETEALKDLKRLMIFAFLREDEAVMKIMIKTEINKKISERIKKPKQN